MSPAVARILNQAARLTGEEMSELRMKLIDAVSAEAAPEEQQRTKRRLALRRMYIHDAIVAAGVILFLALFCFAWSAIGERKAKARSDRLSNEALAAIHAQQPSLDVKNIVVEEDTRYGATLKFTGTQNGTEKEGVAFVSPGGQWTVSFDSSARLAGD